MKAKYYRKDARSLGGVDVELSNVSSRDIIMIDNGTFINHNGIDGGSP